MQNIREYLDQNNNPIVLVSAFHDNGLLYFVDDLTSTSEPLIFQDRRCAIDYAQAITNRIRRTLSQAVHET